MKVPSPARDAVICGAGIVGCSVALELARLGQRVTVVDMGTGPGEGSTSYSSSVVRLFYTVEASARCAWEGYHYWSSWRNHLQLPQSVTLPEFRETGGMVLRSPRSAPFLEQFVPLANKVGFGVEELDLVETKKKTKLAGWDVSTSYVPRLIHDDAFATPAGDAGIEGSVWVPRTAYVSDPRLATQNIMEAAIATGNVDFKFKTAVVGATKRAGSITSAVLNNGEKIEAPFLVNAAGPFSGAVNRAVFDQDHPDDSTIHTRPLRAEVSVLDAPPGIDLDRHGIIAPDFDVGIYMRPEAGNRLLVGSLDPGCDTKVYEDDPSAVDTSFTETLYDTNCYRAGLRMPSIDLRLGSRARGVVALYDSTPDWTPIIDESSIKGYFMAIGTNGNCFKTAPVLGAALASMMVSPQSSQKFHLRRTSASLDLQQFSRLRALHKADTVCG